MKKILPRFTNLKYLSLDEIINMGVIKDKTKIILILNNKNNLEMKKIDKKAKLFIITEKIRFLKLRNQIFKRFEIQVNKKIPKVLEFAKLKMNKISVN